MSEIQLKATNVADKPVRLGDLPVVKTNILENAGQMDKGVVGGYNGAFPLTAASEGGIYLLPSTGKFYVCETAYNGAQISAPNSNFVELSVWKNHDRLANLFGNYNVIAKYGTHNNEVIDISNYKFIYIELGNSSTDDISAYDFKLIPTFITARYKFKMIGSENFISTLIELKINSELKTLTINTLAGVQVNGIY